MVYGLSLGFIADCASGKIDVLRGNTAGDRGMCLDVALASGIGGVRSSTDPCWRQWIVYRAPDSPTDMAVSIGLVKDRADWMML